MSNNLYYITSSYISFPFYVTFGDKFLRKKTICYIVFMYENILVFMYENIFILNCPLKRLDVVKCRTNRPAASGYSVGLFVNALYTLLYTVSR